VGGGVDTHKKTGGDKTQEQDFSARRRDEESITTIYLQHAKERFRAVEGVKKTLTEEKRAGQPFTNDRKLLIGVRAGRLGTGKI